MITKTKLMKTISIINQKGGVGKTTTAVNLGSGLSKNARVLLIDLDKQGSLSSNFDCEVTEQNSVYNLFTEEYSAPVEISENLHIIPANYEMAGIDFVIQNKFSREKIFKKALKQYEEKYDYCILDCPPDMNLVTINALSASLGTIVPVNTDYFGFRGIEVMTGYIQDLREEINPDLVVLGILITSYDDRLKISRQVLEEFKQTGDEEVLFKTKIRKNTAIALSQSAKKTIFDFDQNSNGAIDYAQFTEELIEKLKTI